MTQKLIQNFIDIPGLSQVLANVRITLYANMQKSGIADYCVEESDFDAAQKIIADHDPVAWQAAQDLAALRERTSAAFDLMVYADAATNPVSAEDVAAHIASIVNAHIEAKSVIETAARQATADALTASQGAAGVAAIKP